MNNQYYIWKKDSGHTYYWAGWGVNWVMDKAKAELFDTHDEANDELLEIAGPRPAEEYGNYPHISSNWGGSRDGAGRPPINFRIPDLEIEIAKWFNSLSDQAKADIVTQAYQK